MQFKCCLLVPILSVGLGLLCMHMIGSSEFTKLTEWIKTEPVYGSIIYIASFVLAVTLCCPSTAFEIAAGYIFGLYWGFVLALTSKMLGFCLSFTLGRYLFRPFVRDQMETRYSVFKAIARLIKVNPIKIVALVRAGYLPIALKNYGLSVLDVSFKCVFFLSLLTGALFSLTWCYIGQAAKDVKDLVKGQNESGNPVQLAILIVGIIAAVLLLGYIGYYTRREIRQMASEMEEKDFVNEEDSLI